MGVASRLGEGHLREKEPHFTPRVFDAVGGVDRVALLGLRVQGAHGSGRGLLRVGGADDLAQPGDGIVALESGSKN